MSVEKRLPEFEVQGPVGRDEFARLVREALTRLYDRAYLQNHRLARLVPSSMAQETVGKTLQRALRDAIEAIGASDAVVGTARTGRSYDLLRLRCLDGLAVNEVCDRLAISTREYYREYPKGLEAVTSVLWERWHLRHESRRPPEHAANPPMALPVARPALPAQPLSSFVGRGPELARIREMVAQARLVTLLGPPGTGKTRVVLAAAPILADSFPDGVIFVQLGTVREDASVMPAIAHALGMEATPGVPVEDRLIEGLCDRRLLLILDNFEQVVAAGPALVALLAACPEVRALVTSRIRLNLRGERLLLVPPLAVPDAATGTSAPADVEAVSRFDAVRLFCERAQEVDPDFGVDAANAAVVGEICRRLDGLPLAIELAAARIDTLSPQRLLEVLRSPDRPARLELLAAGASDLPARQQTLRGAIAWSYDLLDEPDRAAFCRLSVFVGGFDFAAADHLLAPDAANATLDRLEALLRRSLLLRASVDGESRFSLLETLREFAAERLAASGEAGGVAERHAGYFRGLIDAAEAGLGGSEQRLWLDRLEREHPNLLAAVAWLGRHSPGDGLRMAVVLARFWHVRGYFHEGRKWIRELLAADDEHGRPRARALIALAMLEDLRGESREYLEEALAISRTIDDEDGVALSMVWLARFLHLSGETRRSRTLVGDALPIARRAASPRTLATVLDHLAGVEVRDGNYDRARAYYAESIDLWRSLGDLLATGRVVTSQGNLARLRGDFAAAQDCFEEGLAIQRTMGYRAGAAWQVSLLGNLARTRGDLRAARAYLREALMTASEFGAEHFRVVPVLFVGQLSLQCGELARGTSLVAAARRLDPDLAFRLDADERADLDNQLTGARAALGAEGFARAGSTGEELTVSAAIDLALHSLER